MKKRKLTAIFIAFALGCTLLTGCGLVTNESSASSSGDSGSGTSSSSTSSGSVMTPAEPLEGATTVLRLSHGDNDTSMLENTWNAYARTFKKSIELYSGGEMTLEIYPNDQLGGTTSCLEQCSDGTLDIALSASVGALSGWVPNVALFDVPYLIDDMDAANLVCQGEILDDISTDLQAAANMRLLSMIQTDFRNLDTWNAPVRSVSDMKGLKMRVQELDPHIAMADAWGTVPTVVAFTELYSAASTGVIDCYENCNYTLFMNNLYETVNYITDTEHAANICVCAMNEDSWESLTEEQQGIITRATQDARRATIGVVEANNVSRLNQLEEAGIEMISLTDEERAEFKDASYQAGLDSVMSKIDADFYEKFTTNYENAKAMMGHSN